MSIDDYSNIPNIENLINGEMTSPAMGGYIENIEPATGQVYSMTPSSDDKDLNSAIAAAERAFPAWAKHAC